MSVKDLLSRTESLGVRLWVDGDQLGFEAPKGSLTDALMLELRERKTEIIGFLNSQRAAHTTRRIEPSPRDRDLPLSFAQQRLWFMCQLVPDSPFYNVPAALRLCGKLDTDTLRRSIDALIVRHETLRTRFVVTRFGDPLQVVESHGSIDLPVDDLSDIPEEDREAEAQRLARSEAERLFDLTNGPLIRARVLRLGEQDHILVLTMHHIISDGWSVGVLLRELAEFYSAFDQGREPGLSALRVQYADFSVWQRKQLQGDVLVKQLSFWKQQLADIPTLQLPLDYTRPAIKSYLGARRSITLSSQLSGHLLEWSSQQGVTLFIVMLAVFKVLLHRYSGQDDIVVGTAIANRTRSEIEGLIGFFVNSLVMRTDCSDDPTFIEMMQRVRDTAVAAYDNQDLPFEKLVQELEPERDLSRNPLFQVTFAVQNQRIEPDPLGDVRVTLGWADTLVSRFDLEVNVWEEAETFRVVALYDTEIFDGESIERLLQHYRILLTEVVANPYQSVSGMPLMSEAEKQRLLVAWNNTGNDYPIDFLAHEMLQVQVMQAPNAIAVASSHQQLTYRQLNQRANQLGRYLCRLGVGPEVRVAVLVERSVEFAVVILAVLKAGGAYLPIDPADPKKRLDFLLRDSKAAVLVTKASLCDVSREYEGEVVLLDHDLGKIKQEDKANLDPKAGAHNLAYTIYTSGSTGRPNGVQITHESLLNLIFWHRRTYAVTAEDRATQLASLGFDASVWEIWPYLASGASVHFVGEEARASPEELWSWMAKTEITLAFLPTPLAEAALQQSLPETLVLRTVLTGGDRLRRHPRQQLPFDLVNHYGPTENTVVSTCGKVQTGVLDERLPSIGRPIDNVQVYVLDPNQHPVPVGVIGELYVGGFSLARGYINQPNLTAERFVSNPFGGTDTRLYKTGDLCRWLSDGSMEFIGRKDSQVKIRGFRVELGEIESVLIGHPVVREAVAMVREDEPEQKTLVAYVAFNDSAMAKAACPRVMAWRDEYVSQWQALYDQTYSQPKIGGEDPGFNIVGWNSSYSGEPIPAEQMREWVDVTVERIQSLRPQRVLEIGCGTGLLLSRIAPSCKTYFGTDFSEQALDRVGALVEARDDLTCVSLSKRMADDFEGLKMRSFDTVIINSVTQYLPSIDYLVAVLEGAVEKTAPGGRLFIGDIRNFTLLRAQHASVQFENAPEGLEKDQLSQRIVQAKDREEELVIDPEFFNALQQRVNRISWVEILLKRGYHQNEMSRFRYDVVMHVESVQVPKPVDAWQEWAPKYVHRLREHLSNESPSVFAIRGIPNARLHVEAQLLDWLASDFGPSTVAEFRASLTSADTSVEPESLWQIGTEEGYYVEITPSHSTSSDQMDVLFYRRGDFAELPKFCWHDPAREWPQNLSGFANNPLKSRWSDLIPQLRHYLKERLPDHMIPASFVELGHMPMTSNNKIDRSALPAPKGERQVAQIFAAPWGKIQEEVAQIWREILDVNQVGVRDNFFDLGGHSLQLMQVYARLVESLSVELSVVELFQYPTIAELSEHIQGRKEENLLFEHAILRANKRRRTSDSSEAIAIVGMACRVPGAQTLDSFWSNMRHGTESISFFTDAELEEAGVDPCVLRDPDYVKAKGVLEGVELFDAAFFGYSPREAELMDPQQRLLLEVSWEALEHAGYDPQRYAGLIGVYVGAGVRTYQPTRGSRNDLGDFLHGYRDFTATTLSYKLNLRGPSISCQTACSTSLVALHQACRSLLDYQCDMAIAGGVSINVPTKSGYQYIRDGILSPDGHCRAFDEQANGTVRGDGLGVVVLKRLADAQSDGDIVHAVIRGTAVNNDGSQKVGFTAPSVEGQAEVIAMAQAAAGVMPDSFGYIETHGTGTVLGDPIEIAALARVFPKIHSQSKSIAIGSLKTNIGHLGEASGVVGVVKAVLAIKHAELPPSLHYTRANPEIDFSTTPFFVNDSLRPWNQENGVPRRAGVSSFGIGGTNAHVVLEEAQDTRPSGQAREWQLLPLSAKTTQALESATQGLCDCLAERPTINLADVAFTLQVGRAEFEHRRVVLCQNSRQAVEVLAAPVGRCCVTAAVSDKKLPLVFMFPGQGSQYLRMGAALYQQEPVFASVVDECSLLLRDSVDFDLRGLIYPENGAGLDVDEIASERLLQTPVAQLALFVVELALARLWVSWGAAPAACIGHSIGEYVAAHLAGVMTLTDALRMVALRGRFMSQTPAGVMLAVPVGEDRLARMMTDGLWLAAINSPSMCVVSGLPDAVSMVESELAEKGVRCQRLKTSHAFHSGLMDSAATSYRSALDRIDLRPPELPFVSNVTGTWITKEDATDPSYWSRHIREPVRFSDGLDTLLGSADFVFLEVGPGNALGALVKRRVDDDRRRAVISSLPQAGAKQSDGESITRALGSLWALGADIDWCSYHTNEHRNRVELPTYPFARQRFWVESQDKNKVAQSSLLAKKNNIADWFYAPVWKQSRLSSVNESHGQEAQSKCWLFFMDSCGVCDDLALKLKADDHDVICVKPGEAFEASQAGYFTVEPNTRNHYIQLANALEDMGKTPNKVVHAWGVTGKDESPELILKAGFYSILNCLQVLNLENRNENLQLFIVSNCTQSVTGVEPLCPEKAIVLGLCKVIPQEFPRVSCTSIDLAWHLSEDHHRAKLADRLVNEFSGDRPGSVVAYRGINRFVQSFELLRTHKPTAHTVRLRKSGVYVITGGLGRIGLVLATFLAQQYRAKLILVGRTALPPEDSWQEWVQTRGNGDPLSDKIKRIQLMQQEGAEVLVLQADVSDKDQLQTVFDTAKRNFGSVNGVIHAAGVTAGKSFELLYQLRPELCAAQFSPKVNGLKVLSEVLSGYQLDFCLLTSSLSTVLGGLRMGAYAAANAFMDCFAQNQVNTTDACWVSVDWDGWQFPGEGNSDSTLSARSNIRNISMLPAEGVEAFNRVLSLEGVGRIVVSTADLQSRITKWNDFGREVPGQRLSTYEDAGHHRPDIGTTYAAPRTKTEESICSSWQELLGIARIGIHDNFFELGGDSLLAVQLMYYLKNSTGVQLSLHIIFDAPTIAELAGCIESVSKGKKREDLEISDVVDMIESLSDEEVKSYLQRDLE